MRTRLRTSSLLVFWLLWLLTGTLASGICGDRHVVVVNDGVEAAYAKAIENLVETAWVGYTTDLGLSLPDRITVNLKLDPNAVKTPFSTDTKDQIYAPIASMKELRPKSGVNHLYGLCHEMGHIALRHGMRSVFQVHQDVEEALVALLGTIVLDYVYDQKGPNLWPVPFDYKRAQGTALLRKLIQTLPLKDPHVAEKGFWRLYQTLGKAQFSLALKRCLKDRPSGADFLPSFLSEIQKVSGKSFPGLFPEQLMQAPFTWTPGPPDLRDETLFKALQVTPTGNDAIDLKYHSRSLSSKPERRESIEGMAYFQLFRLPWEGGGSVLLSVEIFGCRFGSREDDDAEVVVWVCDSKMKILAERKFAYRELNWECGWCSVPWKEPVDIARVFFVGIFFDANADKGYHMGFQKDVSGHSYTGTPWGITLLKDKDWLFRVKVAKTSQNAPSR